jgi:hypothetical protein
MRILRLLSVNGSKTTPYGLSKSLKQAPSFIARSVSFLQAAGLVRLNEERPWRTGLQSRKYGPTFLGLLVGLNSYFALFDLDRASLSGLIDVFERIPDFRTAGQALLATAREFLKTKSLTTGRPIRDEIDDAIQLHGHLMPLISAKWPFFEEMGIIDLARASLLNASDMPVIWTETQDKRGWRRMEMLIYEQLKSRNQLHLLDKLQQDEFTTSFLMLDIGEVERKHMIPFLSASLASAKFDAHIARSDLARQWFCAIAKDEELRGRVLDYVGLRIDALTHVRELLGRR